MITPPFSIATPRKYDLYYTDKLLPPKEKIIIQLTKINRISDNKSYLFAVTKAPQNEVLLNFNFFHLNM